MATSIAPGISKQIGGGFFEIDLSWVQARSLAMTQLHCWASSTTRL